MQLDNSLYYLFQAEKYINFTNIFIRTWHSLIMSSHMCFEFEKFKIIVLITYKCERIVTTNTDIAMFFILVGCRCMHFSKSVNIHLKFVYFTEHKFYTKINCKQTLVNMPTKVFGESILISTI